MPTKGEDLATVLELACLTESRSNAEQRSLLRIARWVDKEANENTVTNKRMWGAGAGTVEAVRVLPESRLEAMVDRTRLLDEDDHHPVRLPGKAPGGNPTTPAPIQTPKRDPQNTLFGPDA